MVKQYVKHKHSHSVKKSSSSSSTEELTSFKDELQIAKLQVVSLQIQVPALESQGHLDATAISLLQSQLLTAGQQVSSLTAQVTALQAQAVIDAETLASLTVQVPILIAQVAALNAQVAALNNPMYGRFILTRITITGGGVYIPPSYTNPNVNLHKLIGLSVIKQITRTGGGYP
jgi:hypothetical protein